MDALSTCDQFQMFVGEGLCQSQLRPFEISKEKKCSAHNDANLLESTQTPGTDLCRKRSRRSGCSVPHSVRCAVAKQVIGTVESFFK